jgi:hypothetical protein
VQERLATEGKCLVPTSPVDAVARTTVSRPTRWCAGMSPGSWCCRGHNIICNEQLSRSLRTKFVVDILASGANNIQYLVKEVGRM